MSLQDTVPFTQSIFSFAFLFVGPVHRLAVMRTKHNQPDHHAVHALVQKITHGKEIAQGFGHLLTLNLQHFIVQPDICEIVTSAS